MAGIRFSLILCNYNHARYLPRSLGALCREAGEHDEIVVLDDGSTDDSRAVLEVFAGREPRMRLLVNPGNRGAVWSAQRALEACSGDFVGWFAADDQVLSGLVEGSAALAKAYPRAGVLASEVLIRTEDGRELRPPFDLGAADGYLTPERLRALMRYRYVWISTAAAFVRRSTLEEGGGWPVELDWLADWFAAYAIAFREGVAFRSEAGAIIHEHTESFGRQGQREQARRDPVVLRMLDLLAQPGFAVARAGFRDGALALVDGLGPEALSLLRVSPRGRDLWRNAMVRQMTRPVTRRLHALGLLPLFSGRHGFRCDE